MMKLKAFSKRLISNNKGQGMVEYILILVVVVAIILAVKGKLKGMVEGDMFEDLKSKIGNVMQGD